MVDPMDIDVETWRVDSEYSLQKDYINLIHINPLIVIYVTVKWVNSFHSCVCGLLIGNTKDIL